MVRVHDSPDAFFSANRRGQLAMTGILQPERVDLPSVVADVRGQLGCDDGRVAVWLPADGIAARPAVQYGLTCLDGTRLTTRTVYDYAEAGDDPASIARLFEVTETDVAQAIEWERGLAA
jgi:uncharacterized protein (DUF433 family)